MVFYWVALDYAAGMSLFDSTTPSKSLQILAGILAIAVLTTLVYWPSLPGLFIFDDTQYIINNLHVRSPDGLYYLWFTGQHLDYYYPLAYTTYWLEWRLWGENATPYRVANVALQIVTALMLWAVLQKLSIPGGFLAGVLYAVHPLNVECVAWIFQRRDLLAVAFGLISVYCFLQADPRFSYSTVDSETAPGRSPWRFRPGGWCVLSVTAYVLGMLCKMSLAPLPVILLVIVWWKERVRFCDLARTAAFFVAGAAVIGLDLWLRAV